MKLFKIFFIVGVLALFGLAISKALSSSKSKQTDVLIGNQKISAEVADTNTLQIKGLSNRDNLDDNAGMLFVFNKPGIYPIWMKEMKFPLDVIWINDGKIVEMATLQIPSDKNIPQHIPSAISQQVLELNVGFIDQNKVKIGDPVIIKY